MEIRKRITRLRVRSKISRAELARLLDTNRRHVWRIETGRLRLLADDLPKYARALRVPVATLVTGRSP